MKQKISKQSKKERKPKLRWQDLCPTCAKYNQPSHKPDCECCRELDISESVLCDLNRMDQENAPGDFECGAYVPLHGGN
jgi:hypothetical protein